MSADARAEAERIEAEEMSTEARKYALPYKAGFIEGAEWQAARPFTEEDVEAAAKALAFADENPWDSMTDTEQWAYMADARAALDAVTARHREGSTP